VEGELGGDGFGSEGAGVFFFIEQLDCAHAAPIVIEVEGIRVIDGVSDFDALADIGWGYFIEGAFEADGGIVVDYAFVAQEEDLIEFSFGQSGDGDAGNGGVVAVDGSLIDAGVDLVVVVVPEPKPEGLVDLFEGDVFMEATEEAFSDGSKEAFDFSSGGAVIRSGVDEGDSSKGTASGEQVGGEAWAVIDIETLGDAVGEESLFEDEGEGADGLGGAEGVADDHAGVIIEDGAEDGLGRAVSDPDLGAVHEVCDPQVVDVFNFVGFSDVGSGLEVEQAMFFDGSEQGVVVDGGMPEKALVAEVLVEFLDGEEGIGLALDLDGLEGVGIEPSGSTDVGTFFGFEGVEAELAVFPQPALHGGDAVLFEAVSWEIVLDVGLLAEVFVLGSFGFGQDGADDLEAFEGDFFLDVLFHGFSSFSLGDAKESL
jgi:hypothetical protein